MNNLIANIPAGKYNYTLTTKALALWDEAQILYGQKTGDFVYGGIEFLESDGPRTYFLFNKYVVICLDKNTATDLTEGYFELSHEVIHLLSPVNGLPASNLEEGLATYFSKFITDRDSFNPTYASAIIARSKYFRTFELVSQLLVFRPDAILELRKIQPVISRIAYADFVAAGIHFPKTLIDELVLPFV
jgi:hypothetical protein